MNWFVEDSTPVLVWGAIFEAILIFALVRTGRVWLLYIMAALTLVVGGIVWHEKHTVTDTKLIRGTLYDAASAIERNDRAAVKALIAPSARDLFNEADRISSTFKFDEVHLTDMKIQVNRFHIPPSATADFLVRVSGADRTGNYPFANVMERVQVTFQLVNERWMVDGYKLSGGVAP